MNRTFRYRLAPTADQAAALGQTVGACRAVYNLALEQRNLWWRQYRRNTGHRLNYFAQSAELTKLRAEVDWVRAASREALDRALDDLDRAFDAHFRGGGYPQFRKRDGGAGFSLRGKAVRIERLNAKWGRVRLDKLGWIKFRLTRPLVGDLKEARVREERGAWFVSLCTEIGVCAVPMSMPGQVGIDRGVANTLALSTGELLSLPSEIEAIDRRRRKAQRVLARRQKGSVRRDRQKARVAALHARARRMRADWLHRVSTDLTRRHGLIAVEALNITAMTAGGRGKRGLNRSILAQCWGQFERQLAYKLEATGGTLVRVPAAYTSQTCSACGVIDARSRESQAVFRCVACGHTAHADHNAALEILRRSTSKPLLVEGARWRPDETRTTGVAA